MFSILFGGIVLFSGIHQRFWIYEETTEQTRPWPQRPRHSRFGAVAPQQLSQAKQMRYAGFGAWPARPQGHGSMFVECLGAQY